MLIDLKTRAVNHQDIGQMNLYLNYFKVEENVEDDNEPIGIVLATDRDEIMVEYATGSISNQLFVSRYQLYLPDVDVLKAELRRFWTLIRLYGELVSEGSKGDCLGGADGEDERMKNRSLNRIELSMKTFDNEKD